VIKWIKEWWRGKYTPFENDPNSDAFFVGFSMEKHWTSRFAHWVVSLIGDPEKRARLLAVIAVATFLILLGKNLSNIDSKQQAANIEKNNTDPKIKSNEIQK